MHGQLSVRRLPLTDPLVWDAWRRLQADGGVPSPFLTWQWCSGVLGEPRTAAGTTVWLVDRRGAVAGLFPVERAIVAGFHTLGPAGWRWLAADHLDVVAAPTHRAAVAQAIAADLLSCRGVDVIDLDGLAADGALAGALAGSHLRNARHRAARLPAEPISTPYLSLRQTPALQSASLRSQVGRGLRAAERAGGGFEVVSDPDGVVRLLDEMMRLHVLRLGAASAVFSTDARRHAHRVAAAQLAADGLARVYRLHAAGLELALLYALRHGPTLSYYSAGMRADASLSPGRTLLGLVALSAAEEGLLELDLLRGEHAYKARFATGTRDDVRVRLLKATPRVFGAVLGRVADASARQLLSRRTRPGRGRSGGRLD